MLTIIVLDVMWIYVWHNGFDIKLFYIVVGSCTVS